jgi:hypothetical protein
MERIVGLLALGSLIVHSVSCNPFAPGLDNSPSQGICPGLNTIEGMFCTFRTAYIFRDSVLYSPLIADSFVFVYRDYENGVDVTWGRDQEMRTTYGLFQNVQNIMLTWNNVITAEGDSARVDSTIRRSFNLTVIFNPSNIEYINGYAFMRFQRADSSSSWKIVRWIDESNF